MSGPPFEIKFTITIDDVVAYLRLLQRMLNAIGVILGLVVMSIGGILGVLTLDAFTGVWTFGIGLLFVLLAGTEFLDRWRVQRSARRLIGSKCTLKFDEDGIDADTVSGSGHVPWTSVTAVKRSDRVLIVKRDRVPIVWIPSRAFASAAEGDALEAFIRSKLAR